MEIDQLAYSLESLLDENKGREIVLLDLRGRTTIADFFLVATGTSQTHVAGLADAVDRFAHEQKITVKGIEGLPRGAWVLIDLGDVVVHLFQQNIRAFYNLEKLWSPQTLLLAAPQPEPVPAA